MRVGKQLINTLEESKVFYVRDYLSFEEIFDFPLVSVDVPVWDVVVCVDDGV